MNVAENPPGKFRTMVDESGDSLRLTMPPQRGRWTTVIFLLFWLFLWSLGGIFAIGGVLEQIRAHTYGVEFLFLSFWCSGWFVAELAVLITVAWNIGGRESVILRGDSLIVQSAVGPLGWNRSFDVSAIHGLHITRRPFALRSGKKIRVKRIAFDTADRTCRFGTDLDDAEAVFICERLIGRDGRLGTLPVTAPPAPPSLEKLLETVSAEDTG